MSRMSEFLQNQWRTGAGPDAGASVTQQGGGGPALPSVRLETVIQGFDSFTITLAAGGETRRLSASRLPCDAIIIQNPLDGGGSQGASNVYVFSGRVPTGLVNNATAPGLLLTPGQSMSIEADNSRSLIQAIVGLLLPVRRNALDLSDYYVSKASGTATVVKIWVARISGEGY